MPDSHPRVFVSYSHDSKEHKERVLALSQRLRTELIDVMLDRYVKGTPPEGWDRWMLNMIDLADFVLLVCTKTYYHCFRGHDVPERGMGADWEGAIITHEIYRARSKTVKFVPMLFDRDDEQWIPEPARGHTFYPVNTEGPFQDLLDFLFGRSGVEPWPLGKPWPTRKPQAKKRRNGARPDSTRDSVDPERTAPIEGAVSPSTDIRTVIVQVHVRAKELMLLGEEFDEFRTFLQPTRAVARLRPRDSASSVRTGVDRHARGRLRRETGEDDSGARVQGFLRRGRFSFRSRPKEDRWFLGSLQFHRYLLRFPGILLEHSRQDR
ncbi:TIR domain-containing protein [Candidatus Sumerlaeota bacterium]|nr:TIR domain-containing protein [Candidatus Sumerlaeota bacterium]